MANNTSLMYSEVYSFINALGESYIKKLPKKLYKTIQDNRSKSYNPVFDASKPLKDGDLSKASLSFIAMLNLQYWTTDKEEQKELAKTYINNNKKKDSK